MHATGGSGIGSDMSGHRNKVDFVKSTESKGSRESEKKRFKRI